MSLPKAAFIDHSFKKRTHSSDFLKQILRREYELLEFWDQRWQGGPSVKVQDLIRGNFAVIFFFQILPPPHVLKKLQCQHFVWFPMYDQEASAPLASYLPYLRFHLKIVCFAQALYLRFQRLGFDCQYYQYFPKALPARKRAQEPIIFFWLRTGDINWEMVKKILGKTRVKAMILKNTPDPGQEIALPSLKDRKDYHLRIVHRWLTAEQYQRLLAVSNIFIAPRKAEGIGLAFLEAMAEGMAVIAPDQPTMNEYIIHGQNGYLYDWRDPRALDLRNFQKVGKQARQYVLEGRQQWLKAHGRLLDYLRNPLRRPSRARRFFCYFIYAPSFFVYNLKSFLRL